jgi:hypothetical protein
MERATMGIDDVRKAISEDGGLYDLGWYLGWTPEDDKACLDGWFSAEELRAIADHMEGKLCISGTPT